MVGRLCVPSHGPNARSQRIVSCVHSIKKKLGKNIDKGKARQKPVIRAMSLTMRGHSSPLLIMICEDVPLQCVEMAQVIEDQIKDPIVVTPPHSHVAKSVNKNGPCAVVNSIILGVMAGR
jgi:hypothetical protein